MGGVIAGVLPVRPIRLSYIGDVPIRPDRSGGSVVLWRHQQLFSCGSITTTQPSWLFHSGRGQRLWRLLRRLRLGRLGLILQPWLHQLDVRVTTEQQRQLQGQADAILTVAHGLGWLEAMRAAQATGLPLITLVHDWYPDASGCPRWALWVWEYCFRQLIHSSALVLPVSEGMARQIGPHPNLQVLPPIPDPQLRPCPPRQSYRGPWRLYYSGLCGGLYRPLLQELIHAVADNPRFALHCSGESHQDLLLPAAEGRLRSSGFLDGEAWQQAFNEADALVLVLSFERRHRRHLATHFPSKLVEYANRARPIVIWGPPWSSAVQWGRGKPQVFIHTTAEAPHLLEAIEAWLPLQPAKIPPDSDLAAAQIATHFEQAMEALFAQIHPALP
jgi:hypothetical protein